MKNIPATIIFALIGPLPLSANIGYALPATAPNAATDGVYELHLSHAIFKGLELRPPVSPNCF